jgi:hypothetical protein
MNVLLSGVFVVVNSLVFAYPDVRYLIVRLCTFVRIYVNLKATLTSDFMTGFSVCPVLLSRPLFASLQYFNS